MSLQIRVSAVLFDAVRQVQSDEETRYYLGGVYIQPHLKKGALLVATDGHRMLVALDVDGICNKAAICKVDKEAFTRKTKAPEVAATIEIDVAGVAALGTYRSVKSVFVDGTYPDWSRVLNPILEGAKKRFHGNPVLVPAAFNSKYITAFGKIADILASDRQGRQVKIVSFTETDPALFLFPTFPNVFGVLMPMRAQPMDAALPGFMKEILEPSKSKSTKAA